MTQGEAKTIHYL
jgi:general stress protein YciG